MSPLLSVLQLFVIAPAILGQSLGLNLTTDMSGPTAWLAQSPGAVAGCLLLLSVIAVLMVVMVYKLFGSCPSGQLRAQETDPADRVDG